MSTSSALAAPNSPPSVPLSHCRQDRHGRRSRLRGSLFLRCRGLSPIYSSSFRNADLEFACSRSPQAGAKLVYAIEASNMAKQLQLVVDQANRGQANPQLKNKIRVQNTKVEDYVGPKVDTLISEPIGVLLVHERMCESYIEARDKFLKPGGCEFRRSSLAGGEVASSRFTRLRTDILALAAMFPSGGLIHLAPFTDEALYVETLGKVSFRHDSTRFDRPD